MADLDTSSGFLSCAGIFEHDNAIAMLRRSKGHTNPEEVSPPPPFNLLLLISSIRGNTRR
jgi:hypothetical protein